MNKFLYFFGIKILITKSDVFSFPELVLACQRQVRFRSDQANQSQFSGKASLGVFDTQK